jgi:hypothetical protein
MGRSCVCAKAVSGSDSSCIAWAQELCHCGAQSETNKASNELGDGRRNVSVYGVFGGLSRGATERLV